MAGVCRKICSVLFVIGLMHRLISYSLTETEPDSELEPGEVHNSNFVTPHRGKIVKVTQPIKES